MWPVAVVITKPVSHTPAQFQSVLIAAQIDVLILEAPPQPFHKPVVHPPSASIHADLNPGFLHRPNIIFGGELRSLVGVGDEGRPVASCQRYPPRLHAE